MKRTLLNSLILVATLSLTVSAQLFQSRLVTSAYGWQNIDTVGSKAMHLFGSQNVQLMLGSRNVTFNTNFQLFNDFAGPVKNDFRLRLSNFSVKVRNIADMFDVQAGRFYVLAGAGIGTIDGGLATVRLPWYPVKVTGYYGLQTPPGQKASLIENGSDNAMMGAHATVQPIHEAQFSLSYFKKSMSQQTYRGIRADSLFNPLVVNLAPSARTEEIVSADLNADLAGVGDLYVRYDYDYETEKMARFNAFGRGIIMPGLSLTAEYLQREPRISYSSIFSVFAYSTLKEVEGGVEYEALKDWFVVAKYGSVSYGDETTNRITLGANSRLISASISRNTTYDGDISAASVNASYPIMDNMVTPTLLVSFANYKLSEKSKSVAALSLAGGATIRPMPTLTVDGQVQWISNNIFANDVRLFLRLSYQLSERLGLF